MPQIPTCMMISKEKLYFDFECGCRVDCGREGKNTSEWITGKLNHSSAIWEAEISKQIF